MSEPLPGSPAKLERIERHLSRQRGAGVRNLVTSFGFSFAPVSNTSQIEAPPLAKRGKSSQAGAIESTKAVGGHDDLCRKALAASSRDGGATERKPRVRRRLEDISVGEKDESAAARDDRRDSFSVTAKRKGRPKKTEILAEARVPTLVDEVPAAAVVPEGRPRRRAAASALVKVTEGFAEEAAPIDKKRRDLEVEKPAARGRKKAPRKATTGAAVAEPADSSAAATSFQQPEDPEIENLEKPVHDVETVIQETKSRGLKRKRKAALDSPTKRIPLGETPANIPSNSPKKLPNLATEDVVKNSLPTDEHEPKSAPVKSEVATRRRKATKIVVSNDTLRTVGVSATATQMTGALELPSDEPHEEAKTARRGLALVKPKPAARSKDGAAEGEQPSGQSVMSTPIASRTTKRPQDTKSAISEPRQKDHSGPAEISAVDQEACSKIKKDPHTRRQKPPRQPELLAITKRETCAKSGEIRQPLLPKEEDVDWLFETTQRQTRPRGPSKRKPTTRIPRHAELPDVDLDDLISNVASWAK